MADTAKLASSFAAGRSLFGAGLLAAGVVCDLADIAITLATPADALPANARWGTVALAGGSALGGALLYRALDR